MCVNRKCSEVQSCLENLFFFTKNSKFFFSNFNGNLSMTLPDMRNIQLSYRCYRVNLFSKEVKLVLSFQILYVVHLLLHQFTVHLFRLEDFYQLKNVFNKKKITKRNNQSLSSKKLKFISHEQTLENYVSEKNYSQTSPSYTRNPWRAFP